MDMRWDGMGWDRISIDTVVSSIERLSIHAF